MSGHVAEGRSRAVIERIRPQVDGGEFPVKRIVGDTVVVDANVFADGHDVVVAVLRYRQAGDETWTEVEMTPLYNDEWRTEFVVDRIGRCEFTVTAWVDRFRTWHRDLVKRAAAGQATRVDLLIGAELIAAAAPLAAAEDRRALEQWAQLLSSDQALEHLTETCDSTDLQKLMSRNASRDFAVTHESPLAISVLRERAGFSAWYEMFPRSAARVPGARDAGRCDGPLAVHRRDGIRRALSAADSPDRNGVSQGKEQRDSGPVR